MRGAPRRDSCTRIVNPTTQRLCQAGEVGEVWLAGAGIAAGYWGRPEESDVTFKATLAGSGEGPYLRTGDLGFIHRGRAVSDRPAQGSDHHAGTELLSP